MLFLFYQSTWFSSKFTIDKYHPSSLVGWVLSSRGTIYTPGILDGEAARYVLEVFFQIGMSVHFPLKLFL